VKIVELSFSFTIFFIGIFIVPANTYLNLENGNNSILIVLSSISFLFGLYLMFINTIRRGNKTIYPIMGTIAVVALIAGQFMSYPSLYLLSAIILLLLPNKKVSSIGKKAVGDALTDIKKDVLEDNTKDKTLDLIGISIEDFSSFISYSERNKVKINSENSAPLNEFLIINLSIANFFLFNKLGENKTEHIMNRLVPTSFACLYDLMVKSGYSGEENKFLSECMSIYNKRQDTYAPYLQELLNKPVDTDKLSVAFSETLTNYYPEYTKNGLYIYSKLHVPIFITNVLKTIKHL
jgi:hypothetical protein